MPQTGTIRYFDPARGLGEIDPDDREILPPPTTDEEKTRGMWSRNTETVLLHSSNLRKGYSPQGGDRVAFEVLQAWHAAAVDVRPLEAA